MIRKFLVATAIFAVACSAAWSQAYPAKPIRLVVPNAAGGGMDILSRLVGLAVGQDIGQPLVVDNKPGAATALGAMEVARSRPDGYTILTADNGTLVFNPLIYKKMNYAPAKDFVPITLLARFPMILVAGPSVKETTAQELIAHAKQNPGKINFGSPGVGSPHQFAMELLKKSAGLYMVHIPYRGAAPAIQDLASGQLDTMMVDLAAGAGFIKAGKVRPLAVANATRLPQLPDVPTFAELGLSAVNAAAMVGIVAPIGTPPEVVSALQQRFVAAVKSPAINRRLTDLGIEPVGGTSNEFAQLLKTENAKWTPLIGSLNITLD